MSELIWNILIQRKYLLSHGVSLVFFLSRGKGIWWDFYPWWESNLVIDMKEISSVLDLNAPKYTVVMYIYTTTRSKFHWMPLNIPSWTNFHRLSIIFSNSKLIGSINSIKLVKRSISVEVLLLFTPFRIKYFILT